MVSEIRRFKVPYAYKEWGAVISEPHFEYNGAVTLKSTRTPSFIKGSSLIHWCFDTECPERISGDCLNRLGRRLAMMPPIKFYT